MGSYREALQSEQYLRRISQKTVSAYRPQPCSTRHDIQPPGRVHTYVATGTKCEMGIFLFGQVGRTVRHAFEMCTSRLPHERRGLVHEELPEISACARKAQKIARVGMFSNLVSSRGLAVKRKGKENVGTSNSTSRFTGCG